MVMEMNTELMTMSKKWWTNIDWNNLRQDFPMYCRRFWKSRCKREIMRTLQAFLCLAIVSGLMVLAQMQSDQWFDLYHRDVHRLQEEQGLLEPLGIEMYARDPLHDRGFDYLPNLVSFRSWLPDLLLTSFIGTSFFFNVLWIHHKRIKFQGLVVLRRIFWIISSLYLFRSFTIIVTTVPSTLKDCVPKYVPNADVPEYISMISKVVMGSVSNCTDNIYSGHTCMVTLMIFCFFAYSGRFWLKIYAILHGACVLLAIVTTRLHYSVDVLVALLLASFIFTFYHMMLTILIDARLLSKQQPPNRQYQHDRLVVNDDVEYDVASAAMIGDTHILLAERTLTLRVISEHIGKVLWWMDGLDLRVEESEPSNLLCREDPASKNASRAYSPSPPLPGSSGLGMHNFSSNAATTSALINNPTNIQVNHVPLSRPAPARSSNAAAFADVGAVVRAVGVNMT